MVEFSTSKKDGVIIREIVKRARDFAKSNDQNLNTFSLVMDVTAVHANGCRLRLDDLLVADDMNFMHDVLGIMAQIDHDTGALKDGFRPRFAVRETAP